MHPGNIIIPKNATRVVSYKLKQVYKDNLRVFQKVRGVEQALIKQVGMDVNKQYIISMKNCTKRQFTVNIYHIFAYLLTTYKKITESDEQF